MSESKDRSRHPGKPGTGEPKDTQSGTAASDDSGQGAARSARGANTPTRPARPRIAFPPRGAPLGAPSIDRPRQIPAIELQMPDGQAVTVRRPPTRPSPRRRPVPMSQRPTVPDLRQLGADVEHLRELYRKRLEEESQVQPQPAEADPPKSDPDQ